MPVFRFVPSPSFDTRAHAGMGLIASDRVHGKRFDSDINFIDLVVVPPGCSIGRHRHVGGDEEVYVVIDGEGAMTVEDEDVTVRRGDVIVNRRGGMHGLVNTGSEAIRLVVIDVLDAATPYRTPIDLG